MEVWLLTQGTVEQRVVTLNDSSGNPVPFTGGEPLAGQVWTGDTQAQLFTITPTWNNAAGGQINVTIAEAQASSLTVGQYRLRITVTTSAGDVEAYEAILAVEAAPGSDTPLPVYCSLQDLTDLCSWIEDLKSDYRDETGFARQRGQAREWWDGLLLRAYKGGGASQIGPGGFFMNTWAYRGTLLQSQWLKGLLDGNGLILTGGVGAQVKRGNAYYALSLVCRQQIGSMAAGRNWAQLASYFEAKAQNEAATCVCEIDTNGDGIGEIPIVLANTNTRYT